MSARFKEFKINGTVGEPGEKGKLTYGSLLHQVNSGIERKFEESEIIAAVIRCITPGNTTRIYLEGRRNLTVTKVMRTMKNHFGEGDVTSVYKQMTGAVQSTKQTAYQFISSMFAMRDRVMELSRQKKSTKRQYSRKLVQEDMQRGIYAGLRDPGIRQDLKQLLRQPNVDDDDLLDELQLVETSKKEHELRFEEAKKKSGVSVSMIGIDSPDSSTSEPKPSTKTNHKPHHNQHNQLSNTYTNANPASQDNTNSNQNNHNRNPYSSMSQPTHNNAYCNVSQNSANTPLNLDPFVAQLTTALGMQMQGIVDPLRAQVNELMGFKQGM